MKISTIFCRLVLATLLVSPIIGMAGCSQAPAETTAAEKEAFAPGVDNLSPEAKALKQKNDQAAAAKQAQVAKSPGAPK